MALTDRKRRIFEETLFQQVKIRLLLPVLLGILHQRKHKLLDPLDKRKQDHDCRQTKDCIQNRNRDRTHRPVHKVKMDDRVEGIEYHRPEHHAEQIVH